MYKVTSLLLAFLVSTLAAADEVPRTITVSGQGTTQVTPDRATVSLTIVTRDPSVTGAQQAAAEVVSRVMALAEELDIPESRVDTMSATIYPDYRYDQVRQEQQIRGYVSQREMRIEIHDLEKVGVIVERAVEQGVNQVTPPRLTSSERREAYREALEMAVEDATANAEQLADTLGVTVGPAIQVSAGSSVGHYPYMPSVATRLESAAMAAQVAVPETFGAGDMSVTASVTVVFELRD